MDVNLLDTNASFVSCILAHNSFLYFAKFCAGSTPELKANKIIQQRALRARFRNYSL